MEDEKESEIRRRKCHPGPHRHFLQNKALARHIRHTNVHRATTTTTTTSFREIVIICATESLPAPAVLILAPSCTNVDLANRFIVIAHLQRKPVGV